MDEGADCFFLANLSSDIAANVSVQPTKSSSSRSQPSPSTVASSSSSQQRPKPTNAGGSDEPSGRLPLGAQGTSDSTSVNSALQQSQKELSPPLSVEDAARAPSPVPSFYSTHEALSSPPRQSRRSSAQPDTERRYSRSSFSSAADAYLEQQSSSYLNVSPPPSRSSRKQLASSPSDNHLTKPDSSNSRQYRSHSDGMADANPSPTIRRVQPQHTNSASAISDIQPSKSLKSVTKLDIPTQTRNDALLAPPSSGSSFAPRSPTQLGSISSLQQTRPRSKSSVSTQATSNSPTAAARPTDPSAGSMTSKLGLRSRLFGRKSTKDMSSSAASLESSGLSPSPGSAEFPTSSYSQVSRSDLYQSDFGSAVDLDGTNDSSSLHSRSTEHEQDEEARQRSASLGVWNTSSTSSFLRKTLRFKDRSAFAKVRNANSPVPASPASPVSPLPPLEKSVSDDQANERPRSAHYRQVSGRRGSQYYEVEPDATPTKIATDLPTRRRPDFSPAKQRPLSYAGNRGNAGFEHALQGRDSPRKTPSRLDLDKRRSTSSVQSVASGSTPAAATQTYVPRSSSLRGSNRNSVQMNREQGASYDSATDAMNLTSKEWPPHTLDNAFSAHPLSPGSPLRQSDYLPPSSPGPTSTTVLPSSPYRSTIRAGKRPSMDVERNLSSPRDSRPSLSIPEEGANYSSTRSASQAVSSASEKPTEPPRPGLPPKNPLRKSRPSNAMSENQAPSVVSQLRQTSSREQADNTQQAPSSTRPSTAASALSLDEQARPSAFTQGSSSRRGHTRSSNDTAPLSALYRPTSASTDSSSNSVPAASPRTIDYRDRKGSDSISSVTNSAAMNDMITANQANGGIRLLNKAPKGAESDALETFRLGKGSKSQNEQASSYPTATAIRSPYPDESLSPSAATRKGINGERSMSATNSPAFRTMTLDNESERRPSNTYTPRSHSQDLSVQRPLLYRVPSSAKKPWTIVQDNLTDEQKKLVRRWFVLRELLETERTYASDLAVARDIYLARAKASAGIVSPLNPLAMRSGSIFSQLLSPDQQSSARGTPMLSQTSRSSTPVMAPRALFRQSSSEANPHQVPASPGATIQANSSASLTSSNPSNRSSMYTASSQSSQTTDATHFLLGSNAPKMPTFPSHVQLDNQSSSSLLLRPLPISPTSPFSPGSTPMGSTQTVSTAGLASGIESVSANDAAFTASDVRIIFAHLESCAALADEMVAVLEDAVGHICTSTTEDLNELLAEGLAQKDEEDRVGTAFLKLMPRIEQVYSAYCSRHEASMTRLQELVTSQPKVVMFLKDCTDVARAHTNAWDLASLLIKPVQRVLKYPLLLTEILSATAREHPDLSNLRAASTDIQKVADNINEVKKRKDLVDQIVSGKTSKRTTGQKVQHGTSKKLLRRQEKVKNLMLGPSEDALADEAQYKLLIAQLNQLEKGISSFARSCKSWSKAIKETHAAQMRLLEQWKRVYALSEANTDADAEERVTAFISLIETRFVQDYWVQVDREVRSNLLPSIQRIAAMFAHPQSVITKRDDRELDYTRYRSEMLKSGNKAVDKKTTESAAAFVALHAQLMDELPQFNYGVQALLDICIESLSRTQATYYLRIHRSLIEFWARHAGSSSDGLVPNGMSIRHVNAVKLFWDVHRSVADYAEGLHIVSGPQRNRSISTSMDSQSLPLNPNTPSTTHFSPLQSVRDLSAVQSVRDLPDPEPTMPNTPLLNSKIDALTAASTEALVPPSIRGASPSATTPPLGARGLESPSLRSASLLGSPAQIESTPLPAGRANKSGGGLIGLLRSVGSNAALNGSSSRKASQSSDTMYTSNSAFDDSTPPTPISKDSSLQQQLTASEAEDAPTLPALSFNSDFFVPSEAVFLDHTAGLGVSVDTEDGVMAAVANSPVRSRLSRNGTSFLHYRTGDLIKVVGYEERYLFGTSESGETGWVERENFAHLA